MRFTFADVMTKAEYLPRLAVAAEAAGYDGFTVPDSIAYPLESDARYPYTADGDRSCGHSKAALRRAATRGDGWMHAGGPNDALQCLLRKLAAYRSEAGTARQPFEIHAISNDARTVDGCKRLEAMGVTDVILGFRNPYIKGPDLQSLEDKIARLERFAEKVICKVNP